jgi:hypothetical protein
MCASNISRLAFRQYLNRLRSTSIWYEELQDNLSMHPAGQQYSPLDIHHEPDHCGTVSIMLLQHGIMMSHTNFRTKASLSNGTLGALIDGSHNFQRMPAIV